jgi:hypothetical protein
MDGCLRGDLSGFTKAGAIIAGLVMTTVGYIVGKVMQRIAFYKGRDQVQSMISGDRSIKIVNSRKG